jgi:hypothetical protein
MTAKVTFSALHPHDPSPSFARNFNEADPRIATRQTYTTSSKMQLVNERLKHKRYSELCLQVRITGNITPMSVDVSKFLLC